MSKHDTASSGSNEFTLFDFGDTIAGGGTRPPKDGLEATVARVQRALRPEADDPLAMPDTLKSQIWENIMHTSNASAQVIADPWAAGPRADSGQEPRRAPRPAPQPPYRGMMWSGAANIALTLVLVLAGFGAFRAFEGELPFDGIGNDTPPAMLPGLAMQPSSPASQVLPSVVAAPEVTPQAAFACDFSDDIPIFPDVSQSPVEQTSLYLTPRNEVSGELTGSLMLHCPEEPKDIELAKRVLSASPGPYAGTVQLSLLPLESLDLSDQHPVYLNLTTGRTAAFGIREDAMISQQSFGEGGPWVVGPSANDPSSLSVVDLRTMESRALGGIIGGNPAEGTQPILSTTANDLTIIGFVTPYTGAGEGGTLEMNFGAPGDIMVLGNGFDDIRWIDLPDTLGYVRNIWLSPDGKTIALSVYDSPKQFESDLTYALISVGDGSVSAQSAPITGPGNPLALWVQDGEAIAYIADNAVQTLHAEPGSLPETVLEPSQEIASLQTSYDPKVIVATIREDHGSDADPNSTDVDMVYSVNVATGETHEFAGMDASASIGWINDAGALVMFQWDDENPDLQTYHVFDPVSGDMIGEIIDAPTTQTSPRTMPTIGPQSIAFSSDGASVEVISLGTQFIYAFTEGSDGMTMQRIDSPEGLLAGMFLTGNVALSPDGSMLSLNGQEDEGRARYLITLDDPDAEWLQVPNESVSSDRGMITFIEGIGS